MGTAFPQANPSISGQLPGSRVTGEVDLIAFYLSGLGCQLRGSTQHWREVYSREFGSLMFFWGVDSSAARHGRVALAKNRTGRCLEESIAAAADWCFRSSRAATGFADRRSRPAHR